MKTQFWMIPILAVLLFTVPMLAMVPGQVPDDPGQTQSGAQSSQETEIGITKKDMKFKVLDSTTGKVENYSAKEFAIGAIAAEMPPSFHTEALKAQGLAALTYAMRLKLQNQETQPEDLKGADFAIGDGSFTGFLSKEQMQERYGENFKTYYEKIEQAAEEICNKLIVYDSQPIVAAYHAISAGKTEAAQNVWQSAVDYLVPVDSVGDELSPDYEKDTSLGMEEVREKLTAGIDGLELPEDPAGWITVVSRTESGTVNEVTVGNISTTGKQVRSLLGLRSADFTVSYANNSFTFTTKGYGHAVGMSQYGADYLARQGDSYEEIVKHYYTGVQVVTIR